MSELLCIPPHYTCGFELEWETGSEKEGQITHARDRRLSFYLGDTEIVVHAATRAFNLAYSTSWEYGDLFAVAMDGGGYFVCGTENITSSSPHSVSEDYEVTTTKLYFLDTRYNNAIGRETIERLTFSYSGSEMAGFKENWGDYWYPKFPITNAVLTTTVNYFIVVDGVKTVLKTNTTTEYPYTEASPLILVYPNPPGQAQPWLNCDDIKAYGFYDYNEASGETRKLADGGADYYFTDWMRMIGIDNISIDQSDAWDRYYTFYLVEPGPASESISFPGIFIGSTPVGSVTRDKDGNIFYSMTLDGEVFNFLTDGNLPALFPLAGENGQYYPVGLA